MTTAQIIILILLFILDVFLTLRHMYKDGRLGLLLIGHTIRMCLTYTILISIITLYNTAISKHPCPEYEKVENVYKIKSD